MTGPASPAGPAGPASAAAAATQAPRPLRVGVIGVGGIGHTHLRAYREAGNPVVAVTDLDPERAAAAAADFGATAYSDVATMLAEADLDAVSVCTPPVSHAAATLAALDAGVAVLCEKPMATSVADCERMRAAAEIAGVALYIGFCHRFQPHVQAMRAAAERGDIGTVLMFGNQFSGPLADVEHRWFSRPEIAGGGVLTDTCVHSIDLFRYLVGDVDEVSALMSTTATERGPALAVEDSAVLTLRSSAGVLGSICASWRIAPGQATVTLSGTDGELRLDYGTLTLTRHPADGSAPQRLEVVEGDRFVRQATHFLAVVRGVEPPQVTAADGVAACDVLARAYRSVAPIAAAAVSDGAAADGV